MSDPTLAELLRQCLVRLNATRGPQAGSGFFVAPGIVLTCAGLVGELRSGRLVVPDDPTLEVELPPATRSGAGAGQAALPLLGRITHLLPEADAALLSIPLADHPCVFLHPDYMLQDALRCVGYGPGRELEQIATRIKSDSGGALPSISLATFPRSASYSGAALLNERTGGVCALMVGARAIDHERLARLTAAYRFIIANLGQEDVELLCQDLGEPYEQLPAQTFTGKVAALVSRFETRGRLDNLIERISAGRVGRPWTLFDPNTTPSAPAEPELRRLLQHEYADDQARAVPIAGLFDAGLLDLITTAQRRYHQANLAWINALSANQIERPGPFFPPGVGRSERCPYPGLRPFNADESRFFFGRAADLAELQRRIAEPKLRLILLSGLSGSGKSSLVAAGLIPALERTSPNLLPVMLRLGDDPPGAIRKALDMGDAPASQIGQAAAALLQTQGRERLLLIIDQFEELFTRVSERGGQAAAEQLAATTLLLQTLRDSPTGAATLLLVIRDDFVVELERIGLGPRTLSERFQLGPLDEKGLREVIEQPARALNVPIESELVRRLVREAEVLRDQGALPLLQLALERLWHAMAQRRLTETLYDERVGGLSSVIQTYADGVLGGLSARGGDLALARRIFLRLVSFGEGHDDTRRQLPQRRLRAPGDDEQFDRTLNHLVDERLLTRSGEGETGRIDIAHEALIRHWQTLRGWLAPTAGLAGGLSLREAEQTRRDLERSVERWKADGELMGRHARIEAARQWVRQYSVDLGDVEGLDLLIAASEERLKLYVILALFGIFLALAIFCGALYVFWLRSSPLF